MADEPPKWSTLLWRTIILLAMFGLFASQRWINNVDAQVQTLMTLGSRVFSIEEANKAINARLDRQDNKLDSIIGILMRQSPGSTGH